MPQNIDEQLKLREAAWLDSKHAPGVASSHELIQAALAQNASLYDLARAHFLLGVSYAKAPRPSYDQAVRFFGGHTNYNLDGHYQSWFTNTGRKDEDLLRGRMRFNYALCAHLGQILGSTQAIDIAEAAAQRLSEFPEQHAHATLLWAYICREQGHTIKATEIAAKIDVQRLPAQTRVLCHDLRHIITPTSYSYRFSTADLL